MPRRSKKGLGESAPEKKQGDRGSSPKGGLREPVKPTVEPQVSQSRSTRVTSSSKARRVSVDVEEVKKVVEEASNELLVRLGLEGLFEVDDVREVVEMLAQSLLDEGRRVTKDGILKRVEVQRDNVYKYLAAKATKEGRDMSRELAEFIVYRAPEIAGRIAPQLYNVVKADSVVLDTLRHLWEAYGKPTPLKCPICGFRAITSNLTCLVCGGSPDEEDVKRVNNFEKELEYAVRGWHRRLIEETLVAGYVYYDGEVKPPSMARHGGFGVMISLNAREKSMLREYLAKTIS